MMMMVVVVSIEIADDDGRVLLCLLRERGPRGGSRRLGLRRIHKVTIGTPQMPIITITQKQVDDTSNALNREVQTV